jgi:peptidoglycan/LPS O-acetylase OafA/YrhL
MKSQRNDTLGILKLFASYMVVFIHVQFYGQIGSAVDALARFAVPFFFLVSGFFSHEITTQKIKERILKLLSLTFLAFTIYWGYNILTLLQERSNLELDQYFMQYFKLETMLQLLLLNVPVHTGHLWYLLAIIYVYILYYYFTAYKLSEKLLYVISLLALILHLLMGEVLTAFNVVIPTPFVRNFALMGVPFFGAGVIAKQHVQTLRKTPTYIIMGSIIFGILETVLSRYFFGENQLYIGSLFVVFSFLVVFIKYPELKCPSSLLVLTKCSTYIYILHPLVSSILKKIYTLVGIDFSVSFIEGMLHPIIVCIISTIMAYLLLEIISYKNKLAKKIAKNQLEEHHG